MINRALVSEEEINCKFNNIRLPNKILILKFMLHLLFFNNQGTSYNDSEYEMFYQLLQIVPVIDSLSLN